MTTTSRRVLVTGVGGGIGQSVVKSLQASDYEVVAVDPDPLAAGLHAAPRACLGPRADRDDFIEAIAEIGRAHGCELVFPGFEPELLPLAHHAEKLRADGILPVVSRPEVVEICDDKWATADFLRRHGFEAPDTTPLVEEDLDPSWFPFVLKPRRGGARSRCTYLIRNAADLDTSRRLVDPRNCVVQEYLDGDEFTCGTVSFDGVCYGVIVMRRQLRDGDTYKAFVVRDAAIEAYVKAVAEALAPFGACNFQLRLKNGRPCIFEINARCSGTTYARTLAGFNEPKMIADRLLRETDPVYHIEEITILRYWRELRVENRRISKLAAGDWISGGTHL